MRRRWAVIVSPVIWSISGRSIVVVRWKEDTGRAVQGLSRIPSIFTFLDKVGFLTRLGLGFPRSGFFLFFFFYWAHHFGPSEASPTEELARARLPRAHVHEHAEAVTAMAARSSPLFLACSSAQIKFPPTRKLLTIIPRS